MDDAQGMAVDESPPMDAVDVNSHFKNAVGYIMEVDWSDIWMLRLAANLIGYSTVVIPTYFLIRHIRSLDRFSDADVAGVRYGWWSRMLALFAVGRPKYIETAAYQQLEDGGHTSKYAVTVERRKWPRWLVFSVCFLGLTFNYVFWGWLQEMLMTQPYQRVDDTGEDRFRDSQFLVFLNRLFAFIISGVYIMCNWQKQPVHTAPFYKYSYASFANVMSSWCQYEALKFVTFPTQTVCKASKIIPVMLMGRLVSGTRYPPHQYATATLLAVGVSLFLLSSDSFKLRKGMQVESTTVSGILLMLGYLMFDAFTPNWQAKLYAYKPRVSSYQMMCGVNLFSAVLCLVSLIEQGGLIASLSFMQTHHGFQWDCILMSAFGAVGQIFIYKTIEQFGPVVFTLIMTVRQILSIIVSCIYYGHSMSASGTFGLVLACASLFAHHYMKTTERPKPSTKTKTKTKSPLSIATSNVK